MGIEIKSKNKGKLHKALGVPKDNKISSAALEKAKKSKSPALRKEANFALNAKKWK